MSNLTELLTRGLPFRESLAGNIRYDKPNKQYTVDGIVNGESIVAPFDCVLTKCNIIKGMKGTVDGWFTSSTSDCYFAKYDSTQENHPYSFIVWGILPEETELKVTFHKKQKLGIVSIDNNSDFWYQILPLDKVREEAKPIVEAHIPQTKSEPRIETPEVKTKNNTYILGLGIVGVVAYLVFKK